MSDTAMITFIYDGLPRTANVKEIAGDFENMSRIIMDDGYENNFFTTIDRPYTWYEQNIGYSDLAQSVGHAIEKVFF